MSTLPSFPAVYRRMVASLKLRAKVVETLQQMSRHTRRAAALQAKGELAEARKALATAERWRKKYERLTR